MCEDTTWVLSILGSLLLRVWKEWDQCHMTLEQNEECILTLLIVTLFQMKKKLQ